MIDILSIAAIKAMTGKGGGGGTPQPTPIDPTEPFANSKVEFMDYDGTTLYEYSANEFLKMTEMPPNPDRTDEGLTALGWNFTLEEAKEHTGAFGTLYIGQMYKPTDEKTHLFVELNNAQVYYGLRSFYNEDAQGETWVDWGDGTDPDEMIYEADEEVGEEWLFAGHTYSSPGAYEIKVDGYFELKSAPQLKKLYLGPRAINRVPDMVSSVVLSDFVGGGIVDVYCPNIVIPRAEYTIQQRAFAHGCLRKISIAPTITEIGEEAFMGCGAIESITIPSSVTQIGIGALGFSIYSALSAGKVDVTIPMIDGLYDAFGGDIFNGTISILPGDNTEEIPELPPASAVYIPDGVASIGVSAFSHWALLENVTLPDTIEHILDSAFYGCTSLKSIVLPAHLSEIGGDAFNGCTRLSSVVIPGGVQDVSPSAFAECTALISAEIEEGVATIASSAFAGCASLQSVSLPSTLEIIADYAFSGCGLLREITIPASVTEIRADAFAGTVSWMRTYHFLSSEPPALRENALGDSPIIYVPPIALDAYRESWTDMGYAIYPEPEA